MKFKNIELHWLGHSGFMLKSQSKVVYIDPYQISASESLEPADVILITHPHYDHCSIEDINKVVKDGTTIIGPPCIQSKITRIEKTIRFHLMEPNQEFEIEEVKIKTVHAYNKESVYHPKEENWLGYIVSLDGTSVYHSGDSDLIFELKDIKADVALLPVGGKFTMDYKDAAEAAGLIKPEITIPMHYGSEIIGSQEDAEGFKKLCEAKGVRCEVLGKD